MDLLKKIVESFKLLYLVDVDGCVVVVDGCVVVVDGCVVVVDAL